MLSLHEESVVVVIGPPGSGKSKVGNLLAESSGLPLYSTEELTTGNKALTALKTIMHLCGDEGFIMEGMIGYRWLRKHKEMELPCPDIVIQLEASDEEIEDAMSKRDKHCNTKLIRKFCAAHEKVLEDYYLLDEERPKVWIHGNSTQVAHLIRDSGMKDPS